MIEINSSGWRQTLCKEEEIEISIGDNEPEVSVMRSKKGYGEILVLLLLIQETFNWLYIA